MVQVTKFLGEEQGSSSIDKALFNRMFSTGMTKDLFIIKSKVPIPHQDKSGGGY